jgi:hypothetical protein
MLRGVALVKADVSEKISPSIIRVRRIGESDLLILMTGLYVPPKRRILQESHGVNIPEGGILRLRLPFSSLIQIDA